MSSPRGGDLSLSCVSKSRAQGGCQHWNIDMVVICVQAVFKARVWMKGHLERESKNEKRRGTESSPERLLHLEAQQ